MSNYAPQAASAHRLIGQKGQTMTLYRVNLAAYDPLNPEGSVPSVEQQCPANGVVLPASNGTIGAFDNRILSDPARRQSFRFVILAGLGLTFTPRAEDVLRTAEGLYRILGATPLNPNGQAAIIFNVGCTLDTQLLIP